jgi:hypothetical protein
MRAIAGFGAVALALAAVGCNGAASDPCKGIAGTCVSLTVQSSTVSAVDTLHIIASGALTGDQTSASGRTNLPVVVALKLPAGTAGSLDLHVDAILTSQLVGSCDTDTQVTAGQHASALCTLVGSDDGMQDLSVDDDGGGDGGAPDMTPVVCDPRGVNMPACVWRWQTPLPVGEDIIGVHMFADNDTIALTSSGALLHRDSTSWSMLPARPTPAIGTFHGRRLAGGGSSITDLYIVGYNIPPGGGSTVDEVFHSADKGGSWTEEMLPSTATTGNNTFFGIAVGASGDVLLAGGFSHIVTRSHSNGAWTDYQTDSTCAPPATGCSTNYNAITSSVLANVATYGVDISRANAGTNSWTLKITGPSASNSIIGLCNGWDGGSNIRYWGVGYGGVVITSTDSTTWALETSNTGALLQGCTAIDNNRIWAFGASGAIVATTNGGVAGTGTWAGQTSGTSNQLLAGSNSPGTALTIVGQAGTILRTMNGGTSYANEQTGPSGSWAAIFGVSPKDVWAAGSGGSIVHSTDGLTWKAIATTGTAANLIGLWASSATNIYAVGISGTLVHSTDGTSFTKYTNPASGGIPASATLYDISGLGANNVFVAADTGLYRSTDNGASFVPVIVTGFTGPAVTAIFAMNGSLWIGGANGQIYATTDGVNFSAQTLTGVGATVHITRIRGRAPSELYATSTDGGWLAHTTNGGMTWTNGLVASLGGSGAYDLAITPSGTVYATDATGNGLAVSQDSGMNFVPVNAAPVPSEQIALYAPSDSEIFATDSGGIVHFGN